MYKQLNAVLIICSILLISLSGCSRYLNKPWPHEDSKLKINQVKGGKHIIDYGSIVLRYKYVFNHDHTKITLDGTVEYLEGARFTNVGLHDFKVTFFFIDNNNITLKMENETLFKATMDDKSYPFKLTFPFKAEYDSLSCFVDWYVYH